MRFVVKRSAQDIRQRINFAYLQLIDSIWLLRTNYFDVHD